MARLDNERLVSIDLFRGIVMFLLLAEHVDIFYLLTFVAPEKPFINGLVKQFFHHEWHGMYFWDLIQPYFTFILGVAMALSINRRWNRGESYIQTFKHISFRSIILFVLGLVLSCCVRQKLVWELWNILTILSLNIFITFLILRFRNSTKLIFSFSLLLITEILYRFSAIDGFDQLFVKGQNFGTFIDLVLMGKTHPAGWVFINFLPTTAHAIWGVVVGNLLMSQRNATEKLKILLLFGIVGVVVGHGIDLVNISPINKHLSTSPFIIASGGWCLITYAFLYWLTDIKGYQKWAMAFVIIGINPIFIYIFSRTIGKMWLYETVAMFTKGLLRQLNTSEGITNLMTYVTILGLEWYLCYWLYKKRILIKI